MMLKVAVRFIAVSVLLVSSFAARVGAQSTQDAIDEFSCTPDECASNWGPAISGGTFTSISASCNNGNQIGPNTVVIDIDPMHPCRHAVLIETSADAENVLSTVDDGCGHYISYYVGEITVHGIVIDTVTNTEIYNQSRTKDCLGGSEQPLPVMGPC
jgi:hypothetical protein